MKHRMSSSSSSRHCPGIGSCLCLLNLLSHHTIKRSKGEPFRSLSFLPCLVSGSEWMERKTGSQSSSSLVSQVEIQLDSASESTKKSSSEKEYSVEKKREMEKKSRANDQNDMIFLSCKEEKCLFYPYLSFPLHTDNKRITIIISIIILSMNIIIISCIISLLTPFPAVFPS